MRKRSRCVIHEPTLEELDWERRLLAAMEQLRKAVGLLEPSVTFNDNQRVDPRKHLALLFRHRGWGMMMTAPLIVNGRPLPYARQGGKHG